MFGYKIIKLDEYERIKKENSILKSSDNSETKNMYCLSCKHCVEVIRYTGNYPFMRTIKVCDLDCDCENFERKK